jgi:hypothetical protein
MFYNTFHNTTLAAVVAGLGLLAAGGAMAADLPKEGTFSATYTATGIYKSTKIGDRTLNVYDENAVQ